MLIDAISCLSLNLYKKNRDGSREKATNHPLYRIVKYSPNANEPPVLFYSLAARDYLYGNVYIKKVFSNGQISSLFILDPAKIDVRMELGEKYFIYQGYQYTSDEIIHIPAKWKYDGVKGYSIYEILRKILEVNEALEGYAKKSFSGFIGKRLVMKLLKLDKNMTDEEIQRKQDMFIAKYGGENNADKSLLRFPDTEYSVLDTGTIDDRIRWLKDNAAFQDERIAKVFGVPLPLINGSYQNNLETIYTVFIETGLKPITTHFEQAFNSLLTPSERLTYYFEYDFNSLKKTDLAGRIDAYAKQINNGMLSPNEAREKENLPGMGSAGDNYFIPANLMPLTEENISAYMAQNKSALNSKEIADEPEEDTENEGKT
jgi:HK97 family phage portal protein